MSWRNRAKCKNCGDIVESKHQHDFVACTCYTDHRVKLNDIYTRHKGTPYKTVDGKIDYEVSYATLYKDPDYLDLINDHTGFFLDGGDSYTRYGGNLDHIIWMTEEEK